MTDNKFRALMGFFAAIALSGGLVWGAKLMAEGKQNAAISLGSAAIAQAQAQQGEADNEARRADLASMGAESPEAIRQRDQADREHENIVHAILDQAH